MTTTLRPLQRLPVSPFGGGGEEAEDGQLDPSEIEVDLPSGSENITPARLSLSDEETPDVAAVAPAFARRKSFFSRAKKKMTSGTGQTPLGARRSSLTEKLFKQKRKNKSRQNSVNADELRTAGGVTFNLEPEIADPASMSAKAREDMAARAMAFERGTYRLEDDLKGLDKEGIMRVRLQLSTATRESGEKIENLLHQHYHAFISASKGIQAMDREVQALRGFLTRENVLLNSLKEIIGSDMKSADKELLEGHAQGGYVRSWADSPEGLRWVAALQTLDIAIAESRPVDALTLLKKTEKVLLPGQKSGLYSHSFGGSLDVKTERQTQELLLRRKRLVELVTGLIKVTTVCSSRNQTATQVLGSLAGRCHALKVFLEAHTTQLRRLDVILIKQHQAGGETDGTEFASALSQQFFGAVSAACEDVTETFGKELKELSAIVTVWALGETERFAMMLKRHALSPFAAPAGLGPTISCCLLAYVHCTSVKLCHGLHLLPRLARDLWSTIDQVLQRRIKRIEEDAKVSARTDIEEWLSKTQEDPEYLAAYIAAGKSWPNLLEVFPSADVLLDELEGVTKLCQPLEGPRLREALSVAYTRLFRDYTNCISEELKRYRSPEGYLPTQLNPLVEAAFSIATAMIQQFLPEMSEPLAKCGTICNTPRLMRQLDAFKLALYPEDRFHSQELPMPSLEDSMELPSEFQYLEFHGGTEGAALSEEGSSGSHRNTSLGRKISSRKASWREYKPSNTNFLEDKSDTESQTDKNMEKTTSISGDLGTERFEGNPKGAIENPFARTGSSNPFSCLDDWRSVAPLDPVQASSPKKGLINGLQNGSHIGVLAAAYPKASLDAAVLPDRLEIAEQDDVLNVEQEADSADGSDAHKDADDKDADEDKFQEDDEHSEEEAIFDPGLFKDQAQKPGRYSTHSARNDSAAHTITLRSAIRPPGASLDRGRQRVGVVFSDEDEDEDEESVPATQNGRNGAFRPIASMVKTPFSEAQDSAEKRPEGKIVTKAPLSRIPAHIVSPFGEEPSSSIKFPTGRVAVSFNDHDEEEDDEDDIEEMDEDLSDYDEDEMIAQLTRKR